MKVLKKNYQLVKKVKLLKNLNLVLKLKLNLFKNIEKNQKNYNMTEIKKENNKSILNNKDLNLKMKVVKKNKHQHHKK